MSTPYADSIDITDLVEKQRSAFVDWAVMYLYGLGLAVPGLGTVIALPVISTFSKGLLHSALTPLSKAPIMQGFFFNTALRKATQSDKFVAAADALAALPEDVSDAEYKIHENARMDSFRNFVVLSN